MPQSLTLLIRSIQAGRFYSFVSVAGLSVAIAAIVLVGALARHELSYETNFAESDRIYRLNWINAGTGDRFATMFNPFSPPLAEEATEVEAAARVGVFEVLVARGAAGPDSPSSFEQVGFADPDFFGVFNFTFESGNAETALAAPDSLVLTRAGADKFFPGQTALGQRLTIENNQEMIVTAVLDEMPATTHFPFHFIVPLEKLRDIYDGAGWLDSWGSDQLYHYLLVNDGVTPEVMHARIMDFAERHIPYDDWNFEIALQALEDIHFTPDLQNEMPIQDTILNIVKSPRNKSDLTIFFAGALVLVLIASFNFMNLQVARGVGRSKQFGLLKVVGASSKNVFQRMMAESLVFAVVSLGVALVLVELCLGLFSNMLAVHLSWSDVFDREVIALVGLVTIALGMASGAYPAWIMASQKPGPVLKGEFKHGQGVNQIRHTLVLLQFTVSIILIAVALVIYAQISYSISAPLGFEAERTAIVQIGRSESRDDYETLRLRLLEHPDVASVSRASIIPTGNLSDGMSAYPQGSSPDDTVAMRMSMVDVDFFETFGMHMAAGRTYSEEFPADAFVFPNAENPTSNSSIIINEASAIRAGWANPADAIGKVMQTGFNSNGVELSMFMEIVGVVEDVHFRSLRSEVVPMIFFHGSGGGRMAVKLATDDTESFSSYMNEIWSDTVPEIPLQMSWLDESVSELYEQETRMLRLLSGVSIVAIGVACLGLFAVASLVTELRRKEVALRKVFGATITDIINLLSWSFLKFIMLANVVAIPIAWVYLSGWLTQFVYRIDLSLMHFLVPAVATIAVAWATVAAQAWTVARRSPIVSLRYE
ncbi:MAG: ABC transporter permease [Woeseiaceae bacterium]